MMADYFTRTPSVLPLDCDSENSGFSLVEFMLSSLILLVIAAAVFGILAETQRAASYQTEVQAVLENTRIAMDSVERILQQAGNDPLESGFQGVTITSPTQVNVRSDLTGSVASDKGDPDGDTNDSGEDITIRFDAANRRIMLDLPNTSQTLADHIMAFSMQYLDQNGAVTATGSDVRRIQVSMTGSSAIANPQTHQIFRMDLNTNVQIGSRQ